MEGQKSPTILVADPDELMRWAVAQRLSREGYVVWQVAEPAEALDGLGRSPDAAVIDAELLSAEGNKLISALETFAQQHHVVLMASDKPSLNLDVDAGAVLEKPFNLDALAAMLADALGGRPAR